MCTLATLFPRAPERAWSSGASKEGRCHGQVDGGKSGNGGLHGGWLSWASFTVEAALASLPRAVQSSPESDVQVIVGAGNSQASRARGVPAESTHVEYPSACQGDTAPSASSLRDQDQRHGLNVEQRIAGCGDLNEETLQEPSAQLLTRSH